MGRKFNTVCVVCAAGAVGYSLYKYWWIPFNKHEAVVTVIEEMELPSDSTESFVDLSTSVEGTIRIQCNLLSRCTFRLVLKSRGSSGGSQRSQSRSVRGPSSSPGRRIPQWEDVETNSIVDPLIFEHSGHLQFIPALCGSYILARYKAFPHMEFAMAATVKQCWLQPAGAPNTYRLSFELHLHETANDVTVSIDFPKGSRLFNTTPVSMGTWRPCNRKTVTRSSRRSNPRSLPAGSLEFVWEIGNFSFKDGEMRRQANHGEFEPLSTTIGPDGPRTNNSFAAAVEETNSTVESERHATSALILPFSIDYICVDPTGSATDDATSSADQATVPSPCVGLSYSVPSCASGIAVDRMKIVDWDAEQSPTAAVTTADGVEVTVKKKPQRSVSHKTLARQVIRVEQRL